MSTAWRVHISAHPIHIEKRCADSININSLFLSSRNGHQPLGVHYRSHFPTDRPMIRSTPTSNITQIAAKTPILSKVEFHACSRNSRNCDSLRLTELATDIGDSLPIESR